MSTYEAKCMHVYMHTRCTQHTQHVQQYKSMFFPILCTHVLCPEPRAVHFSLHKHLKLQPFGQKLQEKRPQARSFNRGLLPPSVYLGRQWHHSRVIKWTRPSPSVFAYCSDQKLDSGKAKERGYTMCALTWEYALLTLINTLFFPFFDYGKNVPEHFSITERM